MKKISYDLNEMKKAGQILNSITLTGSTNFRLAAELADILDSGQIEEKEGEKDGVQ